MPTAQNRFQIRNLHPKKHVKNKSTLFQCQFTRKIIQKYLKISKIMKIMLISIISIVFAVERQRFACSMKSEVFIEKCPLQIWKRYIPLLIDLLISNNFSSITFFCATRILRVIGRQSIVYNDSLY